MKYLPIIGLTAVISIALTASGLFAFGLLNTELAVPKNAPASVQVTSEEATTDAEAIPTPTLEVVKEVPVPATEVHDDTTHTHDEVTAVPPTTPPTETAAETTESTELSPVTDAALLASDYLGSYTIDDATYGTSVVMTVTASTRSMVTNALPNHATGAFPNSGNPNTISAQNSTYTFPVQPTWTGSATWVREPGVAINGVKFEPETAERVVCTSGETYKIEALQDVVDLGLDFNNAHVQPTGAYHYHGVSQALVNTFDTNPSSDLVHVGFALDGYLMYYSTDDNYTASYRLSTTKRTGTGCTYRSQTVDIEGTTPDGTYVSDWEYVAGLGTLDECNGTTIDGTYVYLITDDYPFTSRCLNGAFTESVPAGGGGGPDAGPAAGGPPSGPTEGGQPPAEAIAACASSASGSSCSIETPRGTLSGTCTDLQGTLACVPAR